MGSAIESYGSTPASSTKNAAFAAFFVELAGQAVIRYGAMVHNI